MADGVRAREEAAARIDTLAAELAAVSAAAQAHLQGGAAGPAPPPFSSSTPDLMTRVQELTNENAELLKVLIPFLQIEGGARGAPASSCACDAAQSLEFSPNLFEHICVSIEKIHRLTSSNIGIGQERQDTCHEPQVHCELKRLG